MVKTKDLAIPAKNIALIFVIVSKKWSNKKNKGRKWGIFCCFFRGIQEKKTIFWDFLTFSSIWVKFCGSKSEFCLIIFEQNLVIPIIVISWVGLLPVASSVLFWFPKTFENELSVAKPPAVDVYSPKYIQTKHVQV